MFPLFHHIQTHSILQNLPINHWTTSIIWSYLSKKPLSVIRSLSYCNLCSFIAVHIFFPAHHEFFNDCNYLIPQLQFVLLWISDFGQHQFCLAIAGSRTLTLFFDFRPCNSNLVIVTRRIFVLMGLLLVTIVENSLRNRSMIRRMLIVHFYYFWKSCCNNYRKYTRIL